VHRAGVLRSSAEAVERTLWKSAVVFYLSNLSVLCMHACTGIWEASNKSLNKRSGHDDTLMYNIIFSPFNLIYINLGAPPHCALCAAL